VGSRSSRWESQEVEINGEFAATIGTIIAAAIGLVWRFETRTSGIESRLGGRMTDLSDWVSRIEGLLEGYFKQASGREET